MAGKLEDKITEILTLLDRGDSSAAAGMCDQWRAAEPRNSLAWNISGMVDMRRDNLAAAIAHFEQAVALSPGYAKARCNLGVAYRQAGRTAEALSQLQAAATQAPTGFEIQSIHIQCLLDANRLDEAERRLDGVEPCFGDSADFGMLRVRAAVLSGRLGTARDILSRLVDAHPSHAECWSELGKVAHDLGDLDAAVLALREACRLAPDSLEYLHRLGIVLVKQGDAGCAIPYLRGALARNAGNLPWVLDLADALLLCRNEFEARQLLEESLAQWPTDAGLMRRLGKLECESGNLVRAETLLRAALSGDMEEFLVHHELGCTFEKMERRDDAFAHFREAVRLNPSHAESYCRLGNLHWSRLQMVEAENYYRHTLELDVRHAAAHSNLGMILLVTGRLREGWREYAWRQELPEYIGFKRNFSRAEWKGGPLRGKRLLVHAEQGMGDTLQFVRYVPQLRAKGAYVILECQPPLRRLLAGAGIADVLLEQGGAFPEFDAHLPLLSLPAAMGTTLEVIPHDVPYLVAPVDETSNWKRRVNRQGPGLRVGIAWAGNPKHVNDRKRSISFAFIEPLLAQPGIKWFSLQKKLPDESVRARLATHGVIDWAEDIHDFAATAGLVENLDLVITVDTSVAHLTGALGRPAWVMLPYAPDWRWLLNRTDTPWYPTMRLFRQNEREDWGGVIDEVIQQLKQEVERKMSE